MDHPLRTRLRLGAVLLLPATALAACGSSEPQRSLDRALLPKSQLPARTPPVAREAHDAGADAWVKVTTPDPAARQAILSNLKEAGFERGSARHFRTTDADSRILALTQAVAQVEDSGAARKLAEQSFSRSLKRSTKRGGVEFDPGDLGDYAKGLAARAAGIPAYSITWERGDLVYYLSVVANPNGGPGRRQVVELAQKLDRARLSS